MSLELPKCVEPFIPDGKGFDALHNPAVYCLELAKPEDVAPEWDAVHDHRPAYWDQFETCETVLYVGQTADALRRLEQHRDGEKSGVLMEICEIESVRNIWWMDSKEEAEQEESNLAILLNNQTDASTFVHSR